jgi:two-component system cell cycle sensor histidine kinase/response regulator CckA
VTELEDLREENDRLRSRLAAAEQAVQALAGGEVDALADDAGGPPVLLRRAQAELRERERLFRAVFDGAMDAMLLVDDEGTYMDVNPAACELFGLRREDLVGRRAEEFAEHANGIAEGRARFHQSGRLAGRFALIRRDGLRRDTDFHSTANILPGVHLASLRDMTERRLAEARFTTLTEASSDVVELARADGIITYVSPSIFTVLGYRPDEMVGRTMAELIHPDDVESFGRDQRRLLTEPGMRTAIRFRARHRNGDWRWIAARRTNLLEDPAVRALLSNMSDVTLEVQAREVQAHLASIVEFSDQAIVGHDMGGHVTSWNRAAEKLYGYRAEEVLGKHISLLMPVDLREEGVAVIERVRAGTAVDQLDTIRQRKDGSLVEVRITLSPLRDAAGAVVGVVGMASDLRERKRAEEMVSRLREQLQQAQRVEAIGRLAGGVAHDFNNALSVVLTYSELVLQDLREGDPVRGDIVEIQRAGQRAARLTQQLLAFSRQQVLQPRVLDLNETLSGMRDMLQRLLGEDVELSLLTSNAIGRVNVDPGQVEQIIMNLAVNARDAMPDGGKLTIETSNFELDAEYAAAHLGATPGRYVLLAVCDTGTGMDADTQARIFDPFFTTKEQGKGTGLGLSTVLGIVQQSGGSISVYSEVGVGTTFKVYLPRTDRAVEQPPSQFPPRADLGGSETILLVEDEERVREVAGAVLRRRGYEVLPAEDGEQALAVAEQHAEAIDLLITDVVMPRMSGRQLVERLAERRPGLRVLFMSGYTDDAIVHHGVLEQGVEFLQKPLTPNALLKRVREVLDRTPASRRSPSRRAK